MSVFGFFWIITREDVTGELPMALAIGAFVALLVIGYFATRSNGNDS